MCVIFFSYSTSLAFVFMEQMATKQLLNIISESHVMKLKALVWQKQVRRHETGLIFRVSVSVFCMLRASSDQPFHQQKSNFRKSTPAPAQYSLSEDREKEKRKDKTEAS